jgi:hypothetical protein
MRRRISKMLLAVAVIIVAIAFTSCSSYTVGRPGPVIVTRPVAPYYARPLSPYPNALWIEGEWAWRGGRYVYINGYWSRPVPGRIYVAGHWKLTGGGYYWVPGHWKRGGYYRGY